MRRSIVLLFWLLWAPLAALGASPPSPVPLSEVPLTLSKAAQPQVLFAITNSQSMDGDTNGAILTGSKGCYTPTGGFRPPYPRGSVTTPLSSCPFGQSAYTYKDASGAEYDNSESRLNVAKAGIHQILNDYRGSMEFGLMGYDTIEQIHDSRTPYAYDDTNAMATWVYYMSGDSGFTFTDTAAGNPPSTTTPGSNTYPNPCYQKTGNVDCRAIATQYGGVTRERYLVASLSSDATDINDVMYVPPNWGYPSIFDFFDGPWGDYAPIPDQPSHLSDYNAQKVFIGYCKYEFDGRFYSTGRCPPKSTNQNEYFSITPTNSGYLSTSPAVLLARRGFGYDNTNNTDVGGVEGSAGDLIEPVDLYSSAHYTNLLDALAPETNEGTSVEMKARGVQSAIAGELLSAKRYYQGDYPGFAAPPPSNSCTPLRFVVLVTDGLPTLGLDGNVWPPIGSTVGTGYGLTASFNADGSLEATNDQALRDTIDELHRLYRAKVETYVIGLGAGVDPSIDPMAKKVLTAMAMAGSNGQNSTYFAANNATTLSGDLHQIIGMIQAQALSTSSAAVNSTALRTDSVAYQARFTPNTKPYGDWTGDLLAFSISSVGTVNTSPSAALWSAQAKLDSRNWDTGKVIVTWDPKTGKGIPFRWKNLSAAQKADLMTSSRDTLGPARLDYLRGDTSREERNGGPFRNRSHILGDIVDSAPIWVGPPSAPYPDASYQGFKTAEASRAPVVYVGANDGMLHAFDAATGEQRFAFVPNAVFPNLMALTNPAYNHGHLFYVDGSPAAGDVRFSDGSWHTLLAGGLNNGGNSVYALDVTDLSAWATESGAAQHVLWEFTNPDLGQTYGQPQIARIPWGASGGTRFVVIFGSGYNNADQTPYLFVVDAQTGTLIQRIDLCSGQPASVCDPSRDNGTSGSSLVYPGTDGVAQYGYAGDLQGNLWKIDLSSGNPSTWTVSRLFKATDASGVTQPITTQPVVSRQPLYPAKSGYMVYFGTGRLLGQADLSDTQVQTFYGIWDDNEPGAVQKSKLVQQTVTTVHLGTATPSGITSVRIVSQKPIDWNHDQGWYINLPATGERSVTEPRLVDGRLIFTTYAPDPGSCSGGGRSWLMVLDSTNGGGLTRPQLDINGDHRITSADRVNGKAPSGISLGRRFATSPTVVSTHQGNIGDVKLISESSGDIQSISDAKNGLQGRWSWRQLY